MPVNTQTPFSSPRPFFPAISFKEENPHPLAKKVRQADKIAAYAKSTELVGNFIEGLMASAKTSHHWR